jgi:serine-type D-Ala-D-Ala carboxypeptidase
MSATIIKASEAQALRVNVKRLEQLDTFLQSITGEGGHPSIVIRALRYGTEIFSGAYGVKAPGASPADAGPALTLDTIIPMASVTKTVTATLLAILQEDGVIDFCDRVNRYYPEFTGGNKDAIEIWQLLCHSSGMNDDVMDRYIDDYLKKQLGHSPDDSFSYDEYMQALLDVREALGLPKAAPDEEPQAIQEAETLLKLRAPLAAEVHTVLSYCSTGYELMAWLIERLTGESIDSFAQRRLFEPLSMTDSHYSLPEEKWPRVLKRDPAYFNGDWLNSDAVLLNTRGGNGLKSTVHDLTNLCQMYLNEGSFNGQQVLSPATIRVMTTNHNVGLPDNPWFGRMLGADWGLGWVIKGTKKDDLGLLRSERTFDHGGAGGARVFADPDAGLAVALYAVDTRYDIFNPNHSRIANIIYSALR